MQEIEWGSLFSDSEYGKLLFRLFVYDNCNTNSICCQTINN